MVYLSEKYDAKELVVSLLKEKLIASATIDFNNVSYIYEEEIIKENVYNVITAQSKSLLFSNIVKFIEDRYEDTISINAIPIISSNTTFNEIVFDKTLKV